ncbi:unnamed protein product [Chondrus crispus]|uniref:Uncharacterized protein n=1 Tax=Chondrus crispus TaxID=2769 RepID=R7QHX6_CHOCR|nr:unnamed protein product [Chondrus crispus]CDF37000.1 unnamed protein product [Chondrus crispus]|eukprot:XP_005716819.1 unnamed protein product [Chondrus crispus]
MDYTTAAFAASPSPRLFTTPSRLSCSCLMPSSFSGRSLPALPLRSRARMLRMQATDPEPPQPPAGEQAEGSEPDPTTSATEILDTLRAEAAADDTPSERSMLGVYRDVDGKSNVWAVEPEEKTDTGPQISKTTIIVASAIFIVVALLVLPLLPFTNPDQI